MDGKRFREYMSAEIRSLIDTYRNFQTLIPSKKHTGAGHPAEDGRFVETLIKECLRKYLPKDLEVLTGFIMRPAVKTGLKNRTRHKDQDKHSSQLDIIVYDSAHYPIFLRFGDTVVVPPEGVVAVFSIKKKLRKNHITEELRSLAEVSKLCGCIDNDGALVRKPYLGLVAVESQLGKNVFKSVKNEMDKVYRTYKVPNNTFDDFVGYIGDLGAWSIFKKKPNEDESKAEYIGFEHKQDEPHMGLQFILTGILSVHYDSTRNKRARPGFTAFPSRDGVPVATYNL